MARGAPGMIPTVDVAEAHRRVSGPDAPLLVDVRERNEFATLRVPGGVLLPVSQFATDYRKLPTDRPLLIMCAVGGRSARVTEALLGAGWTDDSNVAGGINAWHAAGLPTRSGPSDPGEGDF
jgi:rhodanese-related sulfurtransferase